MFEAIGPLWSWNEVWLVATGGLLVLAFPRITAIAFSGFYLALFLCALLLRGIAIEVRGHMKGDLWHSFWDFIFAGSNLAITILLGAAVGNVVRGVPLDGSGEFFLPLFTTFGVTGRVGLLDWYTASVGVFSMIVLCAHGAAYLAFKTQAGVHDRSLQWSRRLWMAAGLLFLWIAWATWRVSPGFYSVLGSRAAGWLVVCLLAAGTMFFAMGKKWSSERLWFTGSCSVVVALLGGAAVARFPNILSSTFSPEYSLSAYAGSSGDGLYLGIVWWPIAFGLAMIYMTFISLNYRGKAKPSQDTQGFY